MIDYVQKLERRILELELALESSIRLHEASDGLYVNWRPGVALDWRLDNSKKIRDLKIILEREREVYCKCKMDQVSQ